MMDASTASRDPRCWGGWGSRCSLLVTLGCADVLGIPSAPRLLEEPPAEPALATATDGVTQPDPDPPAAPAALPAPAVAAPTSAPPAAGEVVPAAPLGLAPVTAPVSTQEPSEDDEPPPSEPPPALAPCEGSVAPADLLLILDNSGSMTTETAAVERALSGWAQHLAGLGLDYRLILLSRHRNRERSESEAASTSICVAQPLSSLPSCPSAAPALGERFFHYSIKIDASDSFERALQGFAQADSAGLAPGGWSQWLRPGALAAFIEISDADSAMPAAQFAARLAELAPEHFAGSGAPGFLFYSVVGMAEKDPPEAAYLPEEPIESGECRSADTRPDNAGEQYQTLSVLTGALRFPLCRLEALDGHLERIAKDVLLKARRCVAAADGGG